MSKLYSISVSYADGAFYVKPEESIEAGLLNGMVEASAFGVKHLGGNVAWVEITDRFAKGIAQNSGKRVVVLWSDLPMAAEDELNDWIFEAVSA